MARITILGAGLQGCCIALALARDGIATTLIEQDARPMNRASRRNEGKIHLGLIYAGDTSLATAAHQLEGALNFAPLLERWIGPAADALPLSTPFDYVVASDSIFTPDELAQHYARLETLAADLQRDNPSANYLGRRLRWLARPRSYGPGANPFANDRVQTVFETEELAIDTDALADAVSNAVLREPRITVAPSHQVRSVLRRGSGFRVEGSDRRERKAFAFDADIVINATWENRFAIDAGVGLEPPPGWLHRLKYRVMARLPESMAGAPSATMVLGRYGDVVVRPDLTAYLSWYPLGLRGWTHDLAPPKSWDDVCRSATTEMESEFARAVVSEIAAWYPQIAEAEPYQVDAGAIVAYGHTDVDERGSGLHDRTRIGVFEKDGYFSVDPGKLTTAPLFAEAARKKVIEYAGVAAA